MARQPAPTPVPWTPEAQTTEPDVHDTAIQRRRRTMLGKQRDLFAGLPALIERLNRLAPRSAPAVVDLAQIKHMPLHRPATGHPAVLDDAPVAVLLAVFAAKLV